MGFPGGSAGKESTCNAGYLGWEDPLEKGKATHSSILVWRIPWLTQMSDFQFLSSVHLYTAQIREDNSPTNEVL